MNHREWWTVKKAATPSKQKIKVSFSTAKIWSTYDLVENVTMQENNDIQHNVPSQESSTIRVIDFYNVKRAWHSYLSSVRGGKRKWALYRILKLFLVYENKLR